MISTRKNKFTHSPLVVGTLLGTHPLHAQLQCASQSNVDLIECRLDTFPFIASDHSSAVNLAKKLICEIKEITQKKILLTLRSHLEQGPTKTEVLPMSERRRFLLLKEILPLCDSVDIELRASKIIRQVISVARQHRVQTIGSCHDFFHAPKTSYLNGMLKRARRFNIDVLKLAVTPNTREELQRFLLWGQALKKQEKVLIAMGPMGQPTRVFAGYFGSKLTYGHLGTSAAPGQMSVRDLTKALAVVYVH